MKNKPSCHYAESMDVTMQKYRHHCAESTAVTALKVPLSLHRNYSCCCTESTAVTALKVQLSLHRNHSCRCTESTAVAALKVQLPLCKKYSCHFFLLDVHNKDITRPKEDSCHHATWGQLSPCWKHSCPCVHNTAATMLKEDSCDHTESTAVLMFTIRLPLC